jgi:hypothetical protein
VGVGVLFGLAIMRYMAERAGGDWSGVGSSGAEAKTAMIGVCSPDRSASLIPKIAVANVAPPRAFRVVPVFDSCTAPWTALLNYLIGAQEDRQRPNPKGLASEGGREGGRPFPW